MYKVSLTIALLFLVTVSHGYEKNTQKDLYTYCIEREGYINNQSVMKCSYETSLIYKNSINKSYKTLHKKLLNINSTEAKKLENSQKSWISYRDDYCYLTAKYVSTVDIEYCPMLINKQRDLELQRLLYSSDGILNP